MKHIKEKWYIRSHIGITSESIRINKLMPVYYQNICNNKFPGGTIIAKCVSKNKDELQVNAKLIAAAPELLEALGELKIAVGNIHEWDRFLDEPYKKAIKAIKKAT